MRVEQALILSDLDAGVSSTHPMTAAVDDYAAAVHAYGSGSSSMAGVHLLSGRGTLLGSGGVGNHRLSPSL